jgi:hypothetical protein
MRKPGGFAGFLFPSFRGLAVVFRWQKNCSSSTSNPISHVRSRLRLIRKFSCVVLLAGLSACGTPDEPKSSLSDTDDPPRGGVLAGDDPIDIPDPAGEVSPPQANPLVPNPQGFQLQEFEARVIELTNKERQKSGRSVLSVSPRLQENCRSWAGTMARQRRMYHSNMSFSGENVAWNQRGPEEVVRVWMNSPGHRANILNGSFKTIGVGVVSSNGPYWCQQFGR